MCLYDQWGKPIKKIFLFSADEIVQAIKRAESVKSLRLDGNTLGAEAAKSIAEALKLRPEFEACMLF